MGDSYVTATHPALNSVCCYTLGGKPPCLKKKVWVCKHVTFCLCNLGSCGVKPGINESTTGEV